MVNIPVKIQHYPESGKNPQEIMSEKPKYFFDKDGNKIVVHSWLRWPNYDFVFGTPSPESPKHEKEFAFFQFRKFQGGETVGNYLYLDQLELEEMIGGLLRIMEISRTTRGEEWDKYQKNRPKMDYKVEDNEEKL